MIKPFFFLCFVMSALTAFAQNPLVQYDFEFDVEDALGGKPISTNPSQTLMYSCGIQGEALKIENGTFATLDSSISAVLKDDFGLSFYFKNETNEKAVELISIGNNCSSNRTLRIFSLSDNNEIRAEISETALQQVTLTGLINDKKCFHHVILTKKDNVFQLYVDGILHDQKEQLFPNKFGGKEPIKIGYGACNGLLTTAFEGLIDEFRVYNTHIQQYLVNQLSIPYEMILSNDTTMFLGDKIDIKAVPNCDGVITWTPSVDLSDPNAFETTFSAQVTTVLHAEIGQGICTAKDSIRIGVIPKEDIDCDELILPNVFTPNGDQINDKIGILNGYIIEKFYYFDIFDRWGERVFHTTNKFEKWDGTLKGKAINSNTFLYKISYRCNGQDRVKTGSFSILR